MRGAFAAPDSSWPDASATPAHLRMDGAVTQLLLVMLHVRSSPNTCRCRGTKVNNKIDMILHKLAQACATSSRVKFGDKLMQLQVAGERLP